MQMEEEKMIITQQELQYEDIQWFAIDLKGHIISFTSGVYGNVPEFICKSRENLEILADYFTDNLKIKSDAIILKDFSFGKELILDCMSLSEKGMYCFDAYDGKNHTQYYSKISEPSVPLYFADLPQNIKEIIKLNLIEIDVSKTNIVEVKNAY